MRLIERICLFKIFSLVLFNGCTSEPELVDYNIATRNSSNNSFVFELYVNGDLFEKAEINPSSSRECSYPSEFFRGFSGCNNNRTKSVDSVVIKFDNGNGYLCSARNLPGTNTECFTDKKLFRADDKTFQKLGETEYLFEIVQLDFENAFELPE